MRWLAVGADLRVFQDIQWELITYFFLKQMQHAYVFIDSAFVVDSVPFTFHKQASGLQIISFAFSGF